MVSCDRCRSLFSSSPLFVSQSLPAHSGSPQAFCKMLTKNLMEEDPASEKTEQVLGPEQEEEETRECCHGHCICTRHSVTSPCFSASWKKPFDRVLCGISCCIVFLLMLGVITPLVVNELVNEGIHDAVVIDSVDASSYDVWQSNFFGDADDPPVINYEVYFFDVQNERESLNGSRPVVTEVGPYSFLEYYNKFDISWQDDGDTVTYSSQKFFVFNPERSGAGLSLDDQLVLPYPTVIGFQYLLGEITEEQNALLDESLENATNDKILTIEEEIETLEQLIINGPGSPEDKNASLAKLEALEALLEVVRLDLIDFYAEAEAGDTILKMLMCEANPNGISPYWTVDPVSAYFGWLNDPILVAVQNLFDNNNMSDVPWSTAVPGATTNYTSEEDWSRRNSPTIQKTGKDNLEMAGHYVRYNNMTTQWVCVDSMASQDPDAYVKGEQFPACAHFQYEWSDETAFDMGYRLAFATEYANRIEGNDGQLFGAPALSDKIQMFVSDIYRTLFVEHRDTVYDWYDVRLERYGIQIKDLQNSSMNSEGAWYYNFAPSGMENLTSAAGLPLFVSKPHFLDGDSSLAGSVVGMSPKREAHDTYLDIEPNTGLLARAHKRLQVVYEMNNKHLPAIKPSTVLAMAELCNQTQPVNVSCEEVTALFACMAAPADWKMVNDRVYMPYAWADENTVGSSDDADSIKEIYFIQDAGNTLAIWCYIVSGMLTMVIGGMFIGRHFLQKELEAKARAEVSNPRTVSTNAVRETNEVI